MAVSGESLPGESGTMPFPNLVETLALRDAARKILEGFVPTDETVQPAEVDAASELGLYLELVDIIGESRPTSVMAEYFTAERRSRRRDSRNSRFEELEKEHGTGNVWEGSRLPEGTTAEEILEQTIFPEDQLSSERIFYIRSETIE